MPSLFLICNFIKKKTLTQVFSCEFCEIFKNTFLAEHLRTTASPRTFQTFQIKKTFQTLYTQALRAQSDIYYGTFYETLNASVTII